MIAHLYDPHLISPALWEQAGWHGMGYVFDRHEQEPPRVGPIFRDAEAGCRIFDSWRRRFGPEDRFEVIRLVLVPDLAPDRHAFLLSTAPEQVAAWASEAEGVEAGYVVTHTRVCHLPGPPSPFLRAFQQHAAASQPYLLTPFAVRRGGVVQPVLDLGLLKHSLEVRHAADIAADEPDALVFGTASGG